MKTIVSRLAFLFITTLAYGQIESSVEEIKTTYTLVKLKSEYFPNEERIIKISLPKNYDSTKKYPVIYTLDGSSLFKMVSDYAHILDNQTIEDGYDSGTNVIPPVITVGLFHNNRALETAPNFNKLDYLKTPNKLKNFLFFELLPYINSNYSTSNYNCIIGHSNTAYFATNLMFQESNPFQSIIALSLVEGPPEFEEKLIETLNSPLTNNYFLAYGVKDNEFNLMAKKIKAKVSNKKVSVKKYNANHTDLPATSLVDGIKYMFKAYRNFNNFKTAINNKDFNIENYFNDYQENIKKHYGIDVDILEDDFAYLLVEMVADKKTNIFNMLVDYDEKKNNFKYQPILLFNYRKDLGDHNEAYKIAYQMLESNDKNVFRFLLAQLNKFSDFFIKNLNSPKKAIEFLEIGKKKFPENTLEFTYFIAKTSIENKFDKSKGQLSLNYCIKNFKSNRYFTKSDLEALKQKSKNTKRL